MKKTAITGLAAMVSLGAWLGGAGPVVAQNGDACYPTDAITLAPVSREPAGYPADAHAQGIEGFVVVTYDVGTDGTVENLRLVESEPFGVFEHGVIQSVMNWRYEPPRDRYGNPVRVCGKRQRFTYTLSQ